MDARRLRTFAILLFLFSVMKVAHSFLRVDLYRHSIASYLPFYWTFGGNGPAIDARATRILQESLVPAIPSGAPTVVDRSSKNIVFLVVESLRSDALDSVTMPFLDSLSKHAFVARDHHSTANATPFAVESILAGRWPTGYQVRMGREPRCEAVFPHHRFVTGNAVTWSYWHQDRTLFGSFEDLFHGRPALEGQAGDSLLLDAVAGRLLKDPGPKFIFGMLNATHFKYDFPPIDDVFHPYWDTDYDVANFDRAKAEQMHNRYRNAAHSIDRRLRTFFQRMRRDGSVRNTVVFVTGDHGEEFFEAGHVSHGGEANEYQVKVPLVIVDSGLAGSVEYPTSHADLLEAARILANGVPIGQAILVDRSKGLVAFDATPLPERPVIATAWVQGRKIRLETSSDLPKVIDDGTHPADSLLRSLGPTFRDVLAP